MVSTCGVRRCLHCNEVGTHNKAYVARSWNQATYRIKAHAVLPLRFTGGTCFILAGGAVASFAGGGDGDRNGLAYALYGLAQFPYAYQ